MVDARMANRSMPLAETDMRIFIAQQGYFDIQNDLERRKTGKNSPVYGYVHRCVGDDSSYHR